MKIVDVCSMESVVPNKLGAFLQIGERRVLTFKRTVLTEIQIEGGHFLMFMRLLIGTDYEELTEIDEDKLSHTQSLVKSRSARDK